MSRLELDHVLLAVRDLDAAGARFEERFGLTSVEGGRHPGWGTANRIVPLGTSYLELIAVVDAAEARSSPFGAWVAEAAADMPRLLGWAARTHDLEGVAARHGLTILAGSRQAPDGALLRWRSAGFERATVESSFPFFLEWSPETRFPGLAAGPPAVSIQELRLRGDQARLDEWLGGGHGLPVVVRPGEPAVESLILSGPDGLIVL